MTRRCTLAALLAALSISPAPAASAQSVGNPAAPGAAGTPTVLVMMTADLPEPRGRAVIIRRRDAAPREIIVLPAAGATAADLASALNVLASFRARDNGELPAAQERTSITSAAFTQDEPISNQHYFHGLLERLRRAPTLDVPGIASGRAITVAQPRMHAD